MKTFFISFVAIYAMGLFGILATEAVSTPPPVPLPAEVQAQEFERSANAWISAAKDIGIMAAIPLAAAIAWFYAQVQQLKKGHDEHDANIAELTNAHMENLKAVASGPRQADIDILHDRVDSVARIATDALKSANPASPMLPQPSAIPAQTSSIVAILIACLLFSSCATTAPQKQVLADAFNATYATALAAGASALSGQKGQAVAAAAFTAATTGQPVQQLIMDAVTTNGGTVPQAQQLNSAVATGLALSKASTPAQQAAALNTVGAALQILANQEFSK